MLRGDVDGVRGRQQRAIRLRLQLAVGGLHVVVGKAFAGLAIHADVHGRRRHAAVDDARRTGQHQHLIIGRVGGDVGESGASAGVGFGGGS